MRIVQTRQYLRYGRVRPPCTGFPDPNFMRFTAVLSITEGLLFTREKSVCL